MEIWQIPEKPALSGLSSLSVDYKRYPKSLTELLPNYLDEVPQDPFSGKPLVFRSTEATYDLYSVGPDGDDDDGRKVLTSDDLYGWDDNINLATIVLKCLRKNAVDRTLSFRSRVPARYWPRHPGENATSSRASGELEGFTGPLSASSTTKNLTADNDRLQRICDQRIGSPPLGGEVRSARTKRSRQR